MGAIDGLYAERQRRFLGPDGSIAKDLDNALGRVPNSWDTSDGLQNNLIDLILLIPRGTRTAFDKKTHRRVKVRTQRLTYIFYTAGLIENVEPEEITASVLQHLEEAQLATRRSWGLSEWERLRDMNLENLDPETRMSLTNILDVTDIESYSLTSLMDAEIEEVVSELGRRSLTALYRQLLLTIIDELWVEYLTEMEALRVSIGLEAYAQRDPLVQYKNKAFELFQNLFVDMRTGVVTRMFIYRPRDASSIRASISRPKSESLLDTDDLIQPVVEIPADTEDAPIETAPIEQKNNIPKSKRRKRRRRH